jgi:alcohol dehydrogenase (cytochrome c)
MSRIRRVLQVAAVVLATTSLNLPTGAGEESGGLTPAALMKPSPDSWPTYSGDYSGKRYSALTQIDQGNVKNLRLAWSTRVAANAGDSGSYPRYIGGKGTDAMATTAQANIRGSILQVNGVLYISSPDNAWAVDARSGRILWHYFWKTLGGTHIGNRGLGLWGNFLFMETPDNYLVSLDARTGEERWSVPIASMEEQYFSTTAPVVVGNHVLVGTGNDLDAPGFLQSFDPETGALQWKFYTVPMKQGDPGLETWKNLDAASHGGGNPWVNGSYDPDTHLYIFGTGNPTPSYFAGPRGNGDALFTCSIIAVNVDTGKMAWYYQTSPNDTHDWDSAQTPVLADIPFGGRTRKVAMTAARNGYFFVVDRTTGEHLITSRFSDTVNWAQKKLNAKGQPVRIPAKDHHISGSLVSSANGGAANWPPPSYSPDYGLFYVHVAESWAMYYRAEMDPRGAMGLGGKDEIGLGGTNYLKAIDPKTGAVAWKVTYPSDTAAGGGGILTTAGRLLFAGDMGGNLVARDPANGKPLWHAYLGSSVNSPFGKSSNAPQTYVLDGQQHVLVASGDTLYAFTL